MNPQDDAQAAKWTRLAADQGNASAQYRLGLMYYNGRGVPQDYAEAAKWFRLAADQGYAYAQYNLGEMYRNGQGIPQDYVQAHMWFNLAAAQGITNGAIAIDLVEQMMTPQQIAQAQELARNWKPKVYLLKRPPQG
jgi:TPR repeat protein